MDKTTTGREMFAAVLYFPKKNIKTYISWNTSNPIWIISSKWRYILCRDIQSHFSHLEQEKFPQEWRESIIITIHKMDC